MARHKTAKISPFASRDQEINNLKEKLSHIKKYRFLLGYRKDTDRFRVWRDDWFSDQFEVLTPEEFANLQNVCKRFTIALAEHYDDD